MLTGSGKTSLCRYLKRLVDNTHTNIGEDDPSWYLDDQSFEKMGAMMNDNYSKLFGLYDELAMFLSQMNIFRGKGVAESHELEVFLQLYSVNLSQSQLLSHSMSWKKSMWVSQHV